MNWELITTLTGLMLFSHWLTYIMGNPLADAGKVNVREILFLVPNYLARRRLKRLGLLHKFEQRQAVEISATTDPKTRRELQTDQRADIYLAGREFFTWEKSLLCPICFHWWLTLVVAAFLLIFDGLHARADFLLGVFTYFVNHFIIRKI